VNVVQAQAQVVSLCCDSMAIKHLGVEMNLLEESWIPVRRASGERRLWIAPHQITDGIEHDPIVALDAVRPDFNGALIQFLIGLVQTAWARAGKSFDRDTLLWEPASPESLKECFAPLREAFELDGDGPRFMQDRTLCEADDPEAYRVESLLIDAPGKETIKENRDHFVKRFRANAFCRRCAAGALFTFQTYAPDGGQGHFPSIRKSSQLTTLILHTEREKDDLAPCLWRDVVLNVLPAHQFLAGCNAQKNDLWATFPWLKPQSELQKGDGQIWPKDVHPAHMFWAMPRRIRLDNLAIDSGICGLCGEHGDLLFERFWMKNRGLNYTGASAEEKREQKEQKRLQQRPKKRLTIQEWPHPLTPRQKIGSSNHRIPMAVEADAVRYKHWLGLVLNGQFGPYGQATEPAAVVTEFLNERTERGGFRLWAFGFEMRSNKPISWAEGRFPIFNFGGCAPNSREVMAQIVQWLIAGATLSLRAEGKEKQRRREQDAPRGLVQAMSFVLRGDEAQHDKLNAAENEFWSRTEHAFFEHVEQAVKLAKTDAAKALDASARLRENWLRVLQTTARGLFEQYAASGDVESCHPERLGEAHRGLMKQLHGGKLHEALGLIKPEPPAGAHKTGKSKVSSPRRKPRATDAQGGLTT
jgi:CRISPR system Cascade subunit CasA